MKSNSENLPTEESVQAIAQVVDTVVQTQAMQIDYCNALIDQVNELTERCGLLTFLVSGLIVGNAILFWLLFRS